MLIFRNSQGSLVDIPVFTATRVKNEFGAILEKATHGGAVAIAWHDAPKAVLLSYEEFESLMQARCRAFDNAGAEEEDDCLNRMQSPKAKKGMDLRSMPHRPNSDGLP